MRKAGINGWVIGSAEEAFYLVRPLAKAKKRGDVVGCSLGLAVSGRHDIGGTTTKTLDRWIGCFLRVRRFRRRWVALHCRRPNILGGR